MSSVRHQAWNNEEQGISAAATFTTSQPKQHIFWETWTSAQRERDFQTGAEILGGSIWLSSRGAGFFFRCIGQGKNGSGQSIAWR